MSLSHSLVKACAVLEDRCLLSHLDIAPLRDGAMESVFGGVTAPSVPGTHLPSYTPGNVRQVHRGHRELTAALAEDSRLLQQPARTPQHAPPSSPASAIIQQPISGSRP